VADALMTEMVLESNRGKHRYFRRLLGPLFKLNGNNALVAFTRMVAVSVGTQFILQNARTIDRITSERNELGSSVTWTEADTIALKRAKRYLRELGIDDYEVVLRWDARSQERGKHQLYSSRYQPFSAEAKIVQDAIARFVNESVIRPNAAERPSWARHPLGGLVFHLKTFSYSYSKNILGGLFREGKSRYAEDQSFNSMLPYYMAAIGVFIAMGAISDELRNRIKSLGERGTWDASYRDPDKMVTKWVDRAGFTSLPFIDAVPVPYVQNPSSFDVAFALGPTSSHLYDLFADGDGIDKGEMLRSIPVLSQINAARAALY
jgi:low affinity Fe/Cu permease